MKLQQMFNRHKYMPKTPKKIYKSIIIVEWKGGLWRKVVVAKYSRESDWFLKEIKKGHGVGI